MYYTCRSIRFNYIPVYWYIQNLIFLLVLVCLLYLHTGALVYKRVPKLSHNFTFFVLYLFSYILYPYNNIYLYHFLKHILTYNGYPYYLPKQV